MRRMIPPASLLLTLSSFVTAAPICKWIDAKGVIHFGTQPPQSVRAATANAQTAPSLDNFPLLPLTPVSTIQQKPADPEQKAIDDKVRQQVAREGVECKQFREEARSNLAQLRNSPRVKVGEDKGEPHRLSEGEHQERIARAEKVIQENCC